MTSEAAFEGEPSTRMGSWRKGKEGGETGCTAGAAERVRARRGGRRDKANDGNERRKRDASNGALKKSVGSSDVL